MGKAGTPLLQIGLQKGGGGVLPQENVNFYEMENHLKKKTTETMKLCLNGR